MSTWRSILMEGETVCWIAYFFFSFLVVHERCYLFVCCAESATDFSISLLQSLVTEESSVISELHSLVDALAKVAILINNTSSQAWQLIPDITFNAKICREIILFIERQQTDVVVRIRYCSAVTFCMFKVFCIIICWRYYFVFLVSL